MKRPERTRLDLYAIAWRLPMIVWQGLFFAGPLAFMVAMSFFVMKNYRMEPAFQFSNWQKVLSRGFFWDAYLLTLWLALLATIVTSAVAFPASYVTHSQSEAFAMADRVVIMSQGEIAQIGSARDIYRTPANRFVAEFVGRNNIFTGTANAAGGIETAAGTFELDTKPPAGTPVSFVVAADLMSLSITRPAARNVFSAHLISEEFVGSMVTLFFEAAGGMEVKVQVQERMLEGVTRATGHKVFLSFDAARAHLLPPG